jgi:hypothetical protein
MGTYDRIQLHNDKSIDATKASFSSDRFFFSLHLCFVAVFLHFITWQEKKEVEVATRR